MTTLAAPATRLFTRPFALACAAAFANLTAFYLPLSVVPARVVAAGAPDGAAGLVTAALMLGGVLAECVAPRLMNRFGDRAVLAAGLLLLGGAALLLVPAVDVASAVLVCGCAASGSGSRSSSRARCRRGTCPPSAAAKASRSRASRPACPPSPRCPPGVWLADACGSGRGVRRHGRRRGWRARGAAGPRSACRGRRGAAPAAMCRSRRPAGRNRRSRSGDGALQPRRAEPEPTGRPGWSVSPASPVQRRPAVLFAATTVAARDRRRLPAAGRRRTRRRPRAVRAGARRDRGPLRRGPLGRPARPRPARRTGLAVSGARDGPGCSASTGPPCCSRRWRCSGSASAIAQSATYAVMVERAPAGGHGAVSALWNLAYDLGYGVGPLAFAAVVGASGYPAAFALTGLVVLAGLRRRAASARSSGPGRRGHAGGPGPPRWPGPVRAGGARGAAWPSAAAISATGTSIASNASDTTRDPRSRRHPNIPHWSIARNGAGGYGRRAPMPAPRSVIRLRRKPTGRPPPARPSRRGTRTPRARLRRGGRRAPR